MLAIGNCVFITKRDGKGKIGKIIHISDIDPQFKYLVADQDGNEYWKEEQSIAFVDIKLSIPKKVKQSRK